MARNTKPGAEEGTSTLRERALAAALVLLGEQGLRAVTHTRVDAEAGLPRGSVSNYFRTRRALLHGLVEHLAQQEKADFRGDAGPVLGRDQAVTAFTGMLEAQAGPFRYRTLARYALFVDAAHEHDLLGPLLENRRSFAQWTTAILEAMGSPDPVAATTFLMAALDGLLLHRLTVDPSVDFAPHVARAVEACIRA